MIIPRKKAASADDIIRNTDRDEVVSAEDVWSKRSQHLADAKQARAGTFTFTERESFVCMRYLHAA